MGRPDMACLVEWQGEQATFHAFSDADGNDPAMGSTSSRRGRGQQSNVATCTAEAELCAGSLAVTEWVERQSPASWAGQLGSDCTWTLEQHCL